MNAPARHRFSVDDYYRLAAAGVLAPDARVELVDGEIHDMSPIDPLHGGVVNRLTRLFSRMAEGRWLVSVQNPAHLDDYSEPQPDLLLLKPAPDDYTTHHPTAEDVLLLIEVADSSLEYDRGEKLRSYARNEIQEVWIVNLRDRTIEVHRLPQLAEYGSRKVLQAGDHAAPSAFPDATVNVAQLLRTE